MIYFPTLLLQTASPIGGVVVIFDQRLDLVGKGENLGILEITEEVNKTGSGRSKAGGVLVDLADQALLAFKISRIELPPGFFTNGNPVEDGELLPVNGVGIEGSKCE